MLSWMINGIGLQMAEDLLELTKKPGLQPGDPRWDGQKVTHCNEYVYEAAKMLGYDIEPLLNIKGIGWTNANDMYRNGRAAAIIHGLREHNGKSAQKAANRGRFVVVLAFNTREGSGHLAVVTQATGFYTEKRGPKIVQAGAKNGEFYMNEIFRVKELTTPMFLELKKLPKTGDNED